MQTNIFGNRFQIQRNFEEESFVVALSESDMCILATVKTFTF